MEAVELGLGIERILFSRATIMVDLLMLLSLLGLHRSDPMERRLAFCVQSPPSIHESLPVISAAAHSSPPDMNCVNA